MYTDFECYVTFQISSATTEEEIQMICGEAIDVLMGCSFNKPPSVIRLKDKTALVKALLLHHLILRSKAELDQLKEGLRTLGMADAMQSYPDLFEPLFTAVGQTELGTSVVCVEKATQITISVLYLHFIQPA